MTPVNCLTSFLLLETRVTKEKCLVKEKESTSLKVAEENLRNSISERGSAELLSIKKNPVRNRN